MQLSNKHIVITGGTSGIGREIVERLHGTNHLTVIASNPKRLAALAEECRGVETIKADLSLIPDVEAAASEVRSRADRVDVLINNAAVQYTPQFLDADFDPATIPREIAINLTAPSLLIAHLLPAMMHGVPAAIVNVNSGLGLVPKTSSALYCATKGGLNLFSQSLRHQLEGTNVKVLQAFLPLVDTPMTEGRGSDKLTVSRAAAAILQGIEGETEDHDIGKVKILRILTRAAPTLARRIMKRN